jgi:serine/threonine-protein kinase
MVPFEALASADGDPFLGATVADRFVIVGRLGAGSMGTVYRARQEAVGRDVAVKILRTDRALDTVAKARFGREARAMSLLSSPHTVTVFDFGEIPAPRTDELAPAEASLYLAMELLLGESLGARLKRRGRLPPAEAVKVAREVLLSLAEAHDKGIIHRDLKPDNIFLCSQSAASDSGGEVVKVLDFGIAKLGAESRGLDALETQAGTVFGTPRYMSPEQAQGKELDARSDLYTLGVLLYQMLVGRAPFVDDDAVVVMARHIKSTAVAPIEAAPDAGIGKALSALVMRALAKEPEGRPDDAQTFLAELDAAAAGAAAAAPRGSSPVRSNHPRVESGSRPDPRMARTRAWLIVATSAAVAATVGLVVLGAFGTRGAAKVPAARAEVAHLAASRLLAVLQGAADRPAPAAAAVAAPAQSADPAAPASAAPAAATAAPSAPTSAGVSPGAQSPRKGGRRYKKFEP